MMSTTGFEKAKEAGELLKQLGIEESFDVFLQHHLKEILRVQDPNVEIDSIQFLRAGDCWVDATYTSDDDIARINSLKIPVDVFLVVSSGPWKSGLNVTLVINGTYLTTGYQLTSDLRINHQESLSTTNLMG